MSLPRFTDEHPLGILAPLDEEVSALAARLSAGADTVAETIGGRHYLRGRLEGVPVVLALSRIGKVAAASTAATLILRHQVRALLVTGVAGGAAEGVSIGDVVVGRASLQHDFDCSPLFPRFEIALTGVSRFASDAALSDRLSAAAALFLASDRPSLPQAVRERYGLDAGRLREGLIISGDRFVSTAAELAALRGALPDALAIEMEGGAVAQVCHDHDVPLALLRTISDRADDTAHIDFPAFLREVASHYADGIVTRFLRRTAADQP